MPKLFAPTTGAAIAAPRGPVGALYLHERMLEARSRAHCSGHPHNCCGGHRDEAARRGVCQHLRSARYMMESEAFHSADADQLCLQVPEHRP
jgi:hypothetical protein